ncbi:AAA family ATPase [Kitasatospora sp. NPDC057965]|uniref:AAA family ATPase n=1 Tax=Kitasatospora sp. NPDC057965 TaxID=3346291 RepID=UPI0036DEABBA
MPPTVIIVSGPPATGKTAIAGQLAARLHLPVLGRDRIKESLFDVLGWDDREWSKTLGVAAAAALFALLADTLAAGADCIAESTFRPGHSTSDFRKVLAGTGARAIQIQCVTDGPALLARFAARSATADRHPGHRDEHNLDEFHDELMAGRYQPLDLPGPVITVDTTDFATLDLAALATQLTNLLHTAEEAV